jgi:GNAT superfamily N-acetyltransferase
MPEVIQIAMVRDNLDDLPDYPLPEGCSVRTFKAGEGPLWAEIGASAGNFDSLDAAVEQFDKGLAEPVEDMESRCFFLVDDEKCRAVGTAMAWYDPGFVEGANYGRVHWVAIIPEFQGKGLAKPLMSVVLRRLAESHTKAVLGTQTFRKAAVNLYLDLGFVPCFKRETCPQAWADLAVELGHPALNAYLGRPKQEA